MWPCLSNILKICRIRSRGFQIKLWVFNFWGVLRNFQLPLTAKLYVVSEKVFEAQNGTDLISVSLLRVWRSLILRAQPGQKFDILQAAGAAPVFQSINQSIKSFNFNRAEVKLVGAVFRLAKSTCCTDGGEIWRGGVEPKIDSSKVERTTTSLPLTKDTKKRFYTPTLSSNAFVANTGDRSGVHKLSFKSVTDKTSNFSPPTRRHVKSQHHQSWHEREGKGQGGTVRLVPHLT